MYMPYIKTVFVDEQVVNQVDKTAFVGEQVKTTGSTVENIFIPFAGEGVCVIYTYSLSYMTSIHNSTLFKSCKFLAR